jgi:hypothetical protein
MITAGRSAVVALAWLLAMALVPAGAQNTASIPSATVNAGEVLFEYRASYGTNNNGADDIFSHRIHANYAPTDDLRLMAFIEQRRRGDGSYVFRRLSPNVFTQFVQTENWDLAVRWQGDIPFEDGAPGRARLGLLNTWRFGDLELRSNIYFGREIGRNAPDGYLFEMREEAALRVSPAVQIGAQVFNNFVSTKMSDDFDLQRHQAGPFLRTRTGKSLRLEAGLLFGVSAASPDVEPRLFAGYSF